MAASLSRRNLVQALKACRLSSPSTRLPTVARASVASISRSAARSFATSRIVRNDTAQPADTPAEQAQVIFAPRRDPAKTVFLGNIPFFITEPDIHQLFKDVGEIEHIYWPRPSNTRATNFCHLQFKSRDDAAAVVEGHKEEPYSVNGRTLRINWGSDRTPKYPPSHKVYFSGFNGNLAALKDFLGPHAANVTLAWFAKDRATNTFRNSGIIVFHNVEQATAVLDELHSKPGPDGSQVLIRYANEISKEDKADGQGRKAREKEDQRKEKMEARRKERKGKEARGEEEEY